MEANATAANPNRDAPNQLPSLVQRTLAGAGSPNESLTLCTQPIVDARSAHISKQFLSGIQGTEQGRLLQRCAASHQAELLPRTAPAYPAVVGFRGTPWTTLVHGRRCYARPRA
jgi:hypothetical protein